MPVTPITEAEMLSSLKAKADDPTVVGLFEAASETVTLAFERAWRAVPQATLNDCIVKVAGAMRDGKRSTNAGKQLATVEGGVATRAPLDPLDPIRATLARYTVPL